MGSTYLVPAADKGKKIDHSLDLVKEQELMMHAARNIYAGLYERD